MRTHPLHFASLKLRLLTLASVVSFLFMAKTCGELADASDDTPIVVDAIQVVTGDYMFAPGLEIEVHIFDANSGQFLGCSGGGNGGLGRVNKAGEFYDSLNATFITPIKHQTLLYSDVKDRKLIIRVIENDSGSCPEQEVEYEDDLLGEIILDGSALGSSIEVERMGIKQGGKNQRIEHLWMGPRT